MYCGGQALCGAHYMWINWVPNSFTTHLRWVPFFFLFFHPCFHKWGSGSSKRLSNFPKSRRLVSAGAWTWPDWLAMESSKQSLFMLQTVKRVTLNPKVFNIYSSPHFSVSCPAPIFHIKKSGPGIFSWHLTLQTVWHCSWTLGLLHSFCFKSCWVHLFCHRALPPVPLLGWNEEILRCRMVSGLVCVIYRQCTLSLLKWELNFAPLMLDTWKQRKRGLIVWMVWTKRNG